MAMAHDSAPPHRRGVLVAEITVLVLAVLGDIALEVRIPAVSGLVPTLLGPVVPAVGPATAVLAVLRRRFPRRVDLLGFSVAGLSLLSTVGSVAVATAGEGPRSYPGSTEVLAMALLTGAGCRSLPARRATGVAIVGLVAMVAAPLVRYGIGSPAALLAVPAATLWGGALALGLILRDADTRRRAELADVRAGERLQLARELHDLVAHHVSGIVVRAQAAAAMAVSPTATAQDPVEVYAEIEEAGTEALAATRRLVGMLRTNEPVMVLPGSRFGDAVRAAVDAQTAGHPDVEIDIAGELDGLPVRPELAITVHRVVLEALTNVRRHAPDATEIIVTARAESGHGVLEIRNDGAGGRTADRAGPGYGLVGIAERVTALGGSVRTGRGHGRYWRVTARLPLEPGRILTVPPVEGPR
jgi:signal transduction histidine kinase